MTNTSTTSGAADDSLLLCASDLQHSAIYDNHVEMQACIRAVANRIAALASATPQADSQPAPAVGTIAHVGTGKTTLTGAIASALRAAPVEQPDTARAALPAECDSPELCAVSRSCAGQFGTKRICASRGQAPAGAASVTDAMVLAALQVQYPAGYDTQLRHPANGPKTSARTEAEIDLARRMIAAALATNSAPAAQAPSVLEDAARYRWLAAHCRSTSEHWGGRWSIVVDGPAPELENGEYLIDEAIDAAMAADRKQGANHD